MNSSVRELVIQILHGIPTAMWGCLIMLVVNLQSCSQKNIIQECSLNITCQMLQEDLQSKQLVTNDTTPHHMFTEKLCWKLLSPVPCGYP
jgi:hypothetical protein